ncbi:GAP1-N1 domain-containing protein [Chitinophaga sp. 22620]|uniref:GAP1-N1 domain-containing protein n=1 Tax=Chitinophaga sp. 22620 TaxID=3453952 RepID=UPI003F844B02
MTTLHQSINGDKDGAFALLATSMTNLQDAQRIFTLTDMRTRPADGIEWSPTIRGTMAFDKYFLFLKTFKDDTPGVRAGRIFSHALIASQNDLCHIHDFRHLLALLPQIADKALRPSALQLDTSQPLPRLSPADSPRLAIAVNALLHLDQYQNTIVWVGREGFEDLVTMVWNAASVPIRENLQFDVAFHPREITDTKKINIVWIPPSVLANWIHTSFCLIYPGQNAILSSTAALYLTSDEPHRTELGQVLHEFNITVDNFEDYLYAGRIADLLNANSENATLEEYILTADLTSKLSPDPGCAGGHKQKLLSELAERIYQADAREILGLSNVLWKGFATAEKTLSPALEKWLNKHLLNKEVDTSLIVQKCFEEGTSWWRSIVKTSLKQQLQRWQIDYAPILWQWWSRDATLVAKTCMLLPISPSMEIDLLAARPISISKALSHSVLSAALSKNWLTLHGFALMQLYPPLEALEKQLKVDQVPDDFRALNAMTTGLNDKALLNITLSLNAEKLFLLAAKRITQYPSLLAALDVRHNSWQRIWYYSLEDGRDPWIGVPDPRATLFSLMDIIMDNQPVEVALLEKLCTSPQADLTSYGQRRQLWKKLSPAIRESLLRTTIPGIVDALAGGALILSDLETELCTALAQRDILVSLTCNSHISVSARLQLFDTITTTNQYPDLFMKLLADEPLTYAESALAGKLIIRNYWGQVARFLADSVQKKPDLMPALQECQSLLGLFDKLTLALRGNMHTGKSADDWWNGLKDVCRSLYPHGPTDRGIWLQAGGHEYDLQNHGSGQEIWANALQQLRYRGFNGITTMKLIDTMILENRNNEQLPLLKALFNKL